MAIILEFSLPASSFALGDALEAASNVEIELDRVVPTEQRTLPYLWAEGEELETFERHAASASTVEQFRLVESMPERRLYEVEWTGAVTRIVKGIVGAEGTVLDVHAAGNEWEFRLRFPDRSYAKEFQSHCVETETPVDLSKLYDLSKSGFRQEYSLTEKQYDALQLAYDRGYFCEPREADLADLGSDLDISPRAVSYRLRRGISGLVEHTITTPMSSDGRQK
ncbi:GAF and HTH_10 associated domain-containing protein [Halogranum amylolyticum]|uniref:GAF and HTH_10 associated domain-containing protein n=1 Tax=Halogranum amylolyticum TaxID=660520 RepID=A0A1H8NIG4_9EURY|nr:helix-turn-helix domain-containing protein [Halogranum amylolyticum]SEO29384.1 GAF and HTH_10 associated domain-containing protein [Halogranum amylolyticum]